MRDRRAEALAIGALILMALVWGYNWVVMKVALRFFEPAAFAAMRMFFGSLVLFAVIIVTRRALRPKSLPLFFVIGLFQVAGSTGLATWALEAGGAGKTAVLVYTMPVWLLLMSWFILNERLMGFQWVAVCLALGGLIFVLSPWHLRGTLLSQLLAVASGICWAVATITAKILARRGSVDVLSLSAWQMLLGSVPLVIAAVVTYHAAPIWTPASLAALLFNVIMASGVALMLWFYAVKILPAGTAGLGSLAAPVVGVVSAWIQLGERPDAYEATGMILVVGALAVLAMRQLAVRRGFVGV
ncbi:MAG: EamA family transporter [Actinobacteria bacterium]|nr:EamA family transporter [Actinomycetota bacterium]